MDLSDRGMMERVGRCRQLSTNQIAGFRPSPAVQLTGEEEAKAEAELASKRAARDEGDIAAEAEHEKKLVAEELARAAVATVLPLTCDPYFRVVLGNESFPSEKKARPVPTNRHALSLTTCGGERSVASALSRAFSRPRMH